MKQGDLENLIMNALWDVSMPDVESDLVDVQDVQEAINEQENRSWAYTTVKTVMDRLVDKGWVNRQKQGKKFLYSPVLSREQAGLQALNKLIRQYYQGKIESLKAALTQLDIEIANNGVLNLPSAKSGEKTKRVDSAAVAQKKHQAASAIAG